MRKAELLRLIRNYSLYTRMSLANLIDLKEMESKFHLRPTISSFSVKDMANEVIEIIESQVDQIKSKIILRVEDQHKKCDFWVSSDQ